MRRRLPPSEPLHRSMYHLLQNGKRSGYGLTHSSNRGRRPAVGGEAPVVTADRPSSELEVALLRRSVGAQAASRCTCHACRRTPLVGERIAVYADGRTLCALCRGRRRDAPAETPVVRSSAFGHAVKLRTAA